MALGFTIRASTNNYKWTANSLNQNAELEMTVCRIGGSSSQTTCAGDRRAWPGSSVRGRVSLACGHSKGGGAGTPPSRPGCSISCMAIPGCKIALYEYLPFLVSAQGLYSLWNKAWPSPLHGRHWHIQVILSMLFSKLGFL